MPRNQGTSRKGKPKKGERAAGMGRALTKSQQARYRPKQNGSSRGAGMAMAPGTYSIGVSSEENNNTKSLLEMDDLTDFLAQANMAGREFESERERHIVLDPTSQEYNPQQPRVTWQDSSQPKKRPEFTFAELSVPRRPAWDESTSADELDQMERESFLEWRRAIALREEELLSAKGSNVSVTPFEKNLEVWRQLWRVLERSSCLIQIVDGRNPLFYLSKDLRTYASQELGKPMILLINKSDYLSEKQRHAWHVYLKEQGWDHVFFSAHEEQQKLDEEAAAERKRSALATVQYDDDDEKVDSNKNEEPPKEEDNNVESDSPETTSPRDDPVGVVHPLTRLELMDWLHDFAVRYDCKPDERYNDRIQFGMVGFPNVGKSSVINVLMGSSKHTHGLVRVGVASQPGKTKHFQTLLLPSPSPPIMLCDCPGLVFPSFVSSTADLIAAGVYPIAQMRDHWPVVELICQRIPREVLNAHYGITLPTPSLQDLKERGLAVDGGVLPPPTAEELLATYCIARSMLAASSGVPDYQRAARIVIKDYADGKLLYCHPPPLLGTSNDAVEELDDDAYHIETLYTALRQTKKLRSKLTPLLKEQQRPNDSVVDETRETDRLQAEKDANVDSGDLDLVGIEDDLDLLDVVGGFATSDDTKSNNKAGNKRGKKHKTMHKHGRKGRKDRNKDPYGCHSDSPNDMLMESSGAASSGAIVNAGKYGRRGYTRPNYVGVKNAVQYSSSAAK